MPTRTDLRNKHGTPAEFAQACYACVPDVISMDEARVAIDKYNKEWDEAEDDFGLIDLRRKVPYERKEGIED